MTDPTGGPLRFLVVYASAGAGHKAAATAVAQALSEREPDAIVRPADVLKFMPTWFRALYAGGYLHVAERHPNVWRAIYEGNGYVAKARGPSASERTLLALLGRRFRRHVGDFRPDVVLSTHFMTTALAARVKPSADFRLATLITDYCTHGAWLERGNDRMYAATEMVKHEICTRSDLTGVREENVLVTGIPVDPKHKQHGGRAELCAKHGLDPDRPIVLVMTGMSRSHHSRGIVQAVSRISVPFTLALVSGSGPNLPQRVRGPLEKAGVKYKSFGRVTFLDELMEACDVAVTKAGGLTTTELLVKGKPILFYRPYPGQEERNAAYLLGEGAAMWTIQSASVDWYVARILTDASLRERMKTAARRIARPDAAQAIALDLIDQARKRRAELHT